MRTQTVENETVGTAGRTLWTADGSTRRTFARRRRIPLEAWCARFLSLLPQSADGNRLSASLRSQRCPPPPLP